MKEQRFSSHSPGAVRERLRPKTAKLFARKGAIVWTHEKVGRGRGNATFPDRKSEYSPSSRRNENFSARMQEKQKTIRQTDEGIEHLPDCKCIVIAPRPSSASRCSAPSPEGKASAAAGMGCGGRSKLFLHCSDSTMNLSYKTGAGCSKGNRTAHFCLLGPRGPER